MTTGQELLQELSLEAEVTRRYLVCIPFERFRALRSKFYSGSQN